MNNHIGRLAPNLAPEKDTMIQKSAVARQPEQSTLYQRSTLPRVSGHRSSSYGRGVLARLGLSMGLALCVGGVSSSAFAEGEAELTNVDGNQQSLRAGTVLYVDILDPQTEVIQWRGTGSVDVSDPSGTLLATLASGETVTPTASLAGAYRLDVLSSQTPTGTRWDVEVLNQTTPGGRLHSYNWQFNLGSYASEYSTYASVYAIVPGGAEGTDAVVELSLDGLSGFVYDLNANRYGVDGDNRGRSVAESGNSVTPDFPIYLNPPTNASYSAITPTVGALSFSGASGLPLYEDGLFDCSAFVFDTRGGTFTFTTDAIATYNLQCDFDGDDVFDSSNPDDLLLIGTTVNGTNNIEWDGTLPGGEAVEPGEYNCRVRINVGEFHYVGRDIETSYQGLRMYEVQSDDSRRALPMFWDDSAVQANSIPMPNAEYGLETSGANGINPGDHTTDALANVNARSWGNFVSNGKGNNAFLDTYVWVEGTTSTEIMVEATDSTLDSDGDGLSDYEERCTIGTDPEDPDTDGDGQNDGEEFSGDYEIGAATFFFEDMIGPGENDWDYNDFVVHVRAVETFDEGGLTQIELVYTPLARGAGYIHTLRHSITGLQGQWAATVTVDGVEREYAGSGDLDVPIYERTREAFGLSDGDDPYVNTRSGDVWQDGVEARMLITLSGTDTLSTDLEAAPYDVYLDVPYAPAASTDIHVNEFSGQTEVSARATALVGVPLEMALSTTATDVWWPCEGRPVWQQFDNFTGYSIGGIGAPTREQIFDRPDDEASPWTRDTPGNCQ